MELAPEKPNQANPPANSTPEALQAAGRETERDLQRESKFVAWSVLVVSLALFLVGVTFLRGTTLGFALGFGGALLTFEAYWLLRKIKLKSLPQ